ncbi:MAG: hypothetical protein ACFFD4_12135 [Candidatus Odinarchaeota archaeon]
MNEKDDSKGLDIPLFPGEKVVAVLELAEEEVPGIILTDRRLIVAANLADNVELREDSGRADHFAHRIISGLQSRLHRGLALENIRDIKLEGRKVVVRAKLRRFLPTTNLTSDIKDPDSNMEEIEAFLEEVRNQISKLGQQ